MRKIIWNRILAFSTFLYTYILASTLVDKWLRRQFFVVSISALIFIVDYFSNDYLKILRNFFFDDVFLTILIILYFICGRILEIIHYISLYRNTIVISEDIELCKHRLEVPPPAFAEWCIMIATKQELRVSIVGDLEQQFGDNCRKFGRKRARRMYWVEVLYSVGPLLWQKAKQLGIAAAALAGIKRWIGL